jgi:putative methyltransferase (TIGR04325 family)
MGIKRSGRKWIPPALVDWYLAFKHGRQHQGWIWHGVYENYRDVPVSGPGFDSETWVHDVYADAVASLRSEAFVGAGDLALLPFLSALVSYDQDQLAILDFGGGMGIEYLHVVRSLPQGRPLQYYVVEKQSICEAASKLFAGDSRIHFCDSLPESLQHVDIVHTRSSLQYIEDYRGLISRLAEYRPRFFLFVDLIAGRNPTYATAQQNVRGSVIACWFFNVGEILDLMTGLGYRLVFQGKQDRELDQRNLPESYRLERACNLLFARQPLATV